MFQIRRFFLFSVLPNGNVLSELHSRPHSIADPAMLLLLMMMMMRLSRLNTSSWSIQRHMDLLVPKECHRNQAGSAGPVTSLVPSLARSQATQSVYRPPFLSVKLLSVAPAEI